MKFSSRKNLFLFVSILVLQATATQREKLILSESHHRLTDIDRLCPPSAIKDNICEIKNKEIRLTYDFVYETSVNLLFSNTEIRCVTTQNMPCNLHLKLTSTNELTLSDNTKLIGRQVIIQAPDSRVSIHDISTISASGQSLSQQGTQQRPEDGAQFIGQGGACGADMDNTTTHGNFDMLPNFEKLDHSTSQIGSMGQGGDSETAGGGRIIMIADSFNMTGSFQSLQANAMPFFNTPRQTAYQLVGGSGGYMYLKSSNRLNENHLGHHFRIEAQGGYGTNGNYGGSGGVIVLDGSFRPRSDQIATAGGSAVGSVNNVDGCGNGAAGTLFYKTDSRLIINNEGKQTAKLTIITAPKAEVDPYAQYDESKPSVVAKSMIIDGNAVVLINTKESSAVEFEELWMNDDVTLAFTTHKIDPFTVILGDKQRIQATSTFDFSHIWNVNINATSRSTFITLGNIVYGRILQMNGGNIKINGNVNIYQLADQIQIENSQVVIDGDHVTFSCAGCSLQSTFIFLNAQYAVTVNPNYTITSYVKNTCAQDEDPSLFTCVAFKSLKTEMNQANFLQTFDKRFGTKTHTMSEATGKLSEGFSVYIAAQSLIQINSSDVNGPRIGLCAPDIYIHNSVLNAAEMGCPAGLGFGRGKANSTCAGAGGAHGGYGGYGLGYQTQEACRQNPDIYYYEGEARFEGSAGGCAVHGTTLGGNGGGIIWLSATDTVDLSNSTLTVQGQNGMPLFGKQLGSGGGAGGSIQIITKNIAGNGEINLHGGNGSVYGGGGGSGGRFVAHLLQSYNQTNSVDQSIRWNGTINLEGGKGGSTSNDQLQGGDGQFGAASQTKCFGGFTGIFCKPCPVGSFKYDFGYGVCMPCANKPENSFYNKIASSSSQCDYECVEGFESVDVNPSCLDSLDLQVERVGGARGTLSVITSFFFISLTLWIIIALRSSCIQMNLVDQYASVYDGVLFNDSVSDADEKSAVLGPVSLQMRDSDIWSHTYRMYLIGENSISYPWYLPKDFPSSALSDAIKEKFLRFSKKEQWTMDWTTCQQWGYYLFRIFFPCMSESLHRSIRRQHFRNVSTKLYESFESDEWEDTAGRTVRLSADPDSRLSYVDFLDYRKNKGNYMGPQLPMTLLLAGNGTLSTPYKLNFLSDPLAKSLVYLDKGLLKVKLPPFFQNLNTLLDKLCFFKFNRQTMIDLSDIIEWIELGNKTLFESLNVKIVLYVFENSYQEVDGGSFRQRRRSMPLEQQVFGAFPDLFKRLIKFVQLKTLTQRSEIKLGLVVKSTSEADRRQMSLNIRKITQAQDEAQDTKGSITEFDKTSISLIYNEYEPEDRPKPMSLTKGKTGNLMGLKRDKQLSDTFLSSSHSDGRSVSEFMIAHGSKTKTEVKIVDKNKRAYDTSVESTRALELVLQKDRKRCKHNCARTKSVFYSMWILLFKMHGMPPVHGLNLWFLGFAMAIAFELLVTAVFLLHILHPLSNIIEFGLPFLLVLPGLTIVAPLWGLLGTVMGSASMLKTYSNLNATMVMFNYPLTIVALWFISSQPIYQVYVILLIFNKVTLSFFGSKVRQHFVNPGFAKTQIKMRTTLSDMLVAKQLLSQEGQVPYGLTASQKAQMLASTYKRAMLDEDETEYSHTTQDRDDDDEDSFGIVSTHSLRAGSLLSRDSNTL